MTNQSINIPEETKFIFLYRQNDLYKKLDRILKEKLDKKYFSIAIPKGTENLDDDYKSNLVNIVKEQKEKGTKISSDNTLCKMIGIFMYGVENYWNRSAKSFEHFEDIEASLKKVAERAKNYDLENMVINLLGLYDKNRFSCGSDIWCHGLTIKDKRGKEIQYNRKNNKYFCSIEGIKEVYEFLKKPFVEKRFNVYPSLYGKRSDEFFGFHPLKELDLKINDVNDDAHAAVLKIGEEVALNPEKTGVLVDRHIDSLYGFNKAVIFHKHEGAVMQDKKTDEFIYPCDLDDCKFLNKVVEVISSECK